MAGLGLDEAVGFRPGVREEAGEGGGTSPPAVQGHSLQGFQHFLLRAGGALRRLRDAQPSEYCITGLLPDLLPALRVREKPPFFVPGPGMAVFRIRQGGPEGIRQLPGQIGQRIRRGEQAPVRGDRIDLRLDFLPCAQPLACRVQTPVRYAQAPACRAQALVRYAQALARRILAPARRIHALRVPREGQQPPPGGQALFR